MINALSSASISHAARPQPAAAPAAPAAPKDAVTLGARRAYGSVSGEIGRYLLNASYGEDAGGAELSGYYGPNSVNLHESFFAGGANIFGTISGPGGFRDVNVSVQDASTPGHVQKYFSGEIGFAPVNMQESGQGGFEFISGSSGGAWVNVTRTNVGGFTSFNGSGGVGGVSVSATAGSQAGYDALIPLFGAV